MWIGWHPETLNNFFNRAILDLFFGLFKSLYLIQLIVNKIADDCISSVTEETVSTELYYLLNGGLVGVLVYLLWHYKFDSYWNLQFFILQEKFFEIKENKQKEARKGPWTISRENGPVMIRSCVLWLSVNNFLPKCTKNCTTFSLTK